jgi:hypothetical protein
MRNKFYLILAIGAVTTGIDMGCGSANTPTPADHTKQLLTQKSWNLISYGIDENINGTLDGEEPMIKDCEKDDVYSFYSDYTGSINDNTVVCNPTPVPAFTWHLTGNDYSSLTFLGQIYSIANLDSNNLILKKDTITSGGQSTQFISAYHRD